MSLADRACGTERAAGRLREAVAQERTGACVVEVASDALTFASGHLKVAATLGPLYWPAFERNIFMTRPLARLRPQLRRSLGRLGRGWLRAGEKAACGCVWGFRLRHAGNPRHPGGCCWARCGLAALYREGDNSGKEQRSGLLVAKFAWDGVDKVLWSNNVLRIAAIDGVAGKGGMVAKILRSSAAVLTSAIGVVQPSNAYSRADWKARCAGSQRFDQTDDLVSRNYRRFLGNQFPFNHVQVGAADAAVGDANQDLPVGGLRSGIVREHERVRFDTSRGLEDASFHGRDTPTPRCFAKKHCKFLKTKNSTHKKKPTTT